MQIERIGPRNGERQQKKYALWYLEMKRYTHVQNSLVQTGLAGNEANVQTGRNIHSEDLLVIFFVVAFRNCYSEDWSMVVTEV